MKLLKGIAAAAKKMQASRSGFRVRAAKAVRKAKLIKEANAKIRQVK